ncbi:MAG: hypothetical protein QG646_1101 [Euryarchaeota archaeon]|nr:hypothetical protein [Euryarchaeota archaeon]
MKNLLAILIVVFLMSVSLVACDTGKTQISKCARCNCTDNNSLDVIGSELIGYGKYLNLGNGYVLSGTNYIGDSGIIFDLLKDEISVCDITVTNSGQCYCYDENGNAILHMEFDEMINKGPKDLPPKYYVRWEWLPLER